jgi:type II pantothenate kinase
MDDVVVRGRRGSLHFIRFPTASMGKFLALAKAKGMATLVSSVCATGGGAYKFEDNFRKVILSDTQLPYEIYLISYYLQYKNFS